MRAKVIATGEIIEVEFIKQQQYIYNADVYKASDGREFDNSDLEFETDIDWEQRRFELVKAAMQGILTNPITKTITNEVIDMAISTADAIIAKLKEE